MVNNMEKRFSSFIVFVAFALISIAHGAASSSGSGVTSFAAGSQPERKHAQCIMLIDTSGEDTHGQVGSVLSAFAGIIHSGSFADTPLLISDSILYNYLYRNKRRDFVDDEALLDFFYGDPINWSRWDILRVNNTQFTLFVPKGYTKINPHGLLLDKKHITVLPSTSEALLAWLESNRWRWHIPFLPEQLRYVFRTRKQAEDAEDTVGQSLMPIWDIIINGHGTPQSDTFRNDAWIAGMPAIVMQNVLKFLNKELCVGTLFIETCSAGGNNLNLLQFDQIIGKHVLLQLNFIVIVGAVGDDYIWFEQDTTIRKWLAFFNMTSKEEELSKLLQILGSIRQRGSHDPHASSNIPQVWIPGGYGFQTYQVDERIKVLSKVLVAAHEDEERPIIIPETTEVVLVYPKRIDVPIHVGMRQFPKITPEGLKMRLKAWRQFPTVYELMEEGRWVEGFDVADDGNALYPKFVSMVRGRHAAQYFKHIILEPEKPTKGGIAAFMRDAFIDANKYLQRETDSRKRMTIQIDELEGVNDLSLLLAMGKDMGAVESEFEKVLRPFIGQKISLKHVAIDITMEATTTITIEFKFADMFWKLSYNSSNYSSPDTKNKIAWIFSENENPWPLIRYDRLMNIVFKRKPVLDSSRISHVLRRKTSSTDLSRAPGPSSSSSGGGL